LPTRWLRQGRGGSHHCDVPDAQRVLAVAELAPAVDFRLAGERVVEQALLEGLARIEAQIDVEARRTLRAHVQARRTVDVDTRIRAARDVLAFEVPVLVAEVRQLDVLVTIDREQRIEATERDAAGAGGGCRGLSTHLHYKLQKT